MIIISIRRQTLLLLALALAVLVLVVNFLFLKKSPAEQSETVPAVSEDEWYGVFETLFSLKNASLISGEPANLSAVYAPNERNGKWAMELEIQRAEYLKSWSVKQGVYFVSIVSHFIIKSIKKVGRGYAFYLVVSTEYKYVYMDAPDTVNMFRVGTYHSIDLIPGVSENTWVISREWYLDVFNDVLDYQKLNTGEITAYINGQQAKESAPLSERRQGAVDYANRYCGAAAGDENGYEYNDQYPDFKSSGGDCSNFVSQALYEGGGFSKTYAWNCTSSEASRAWCNAQGFKNYMVNSGRASVIVKGSYGLVYKLAYELMPGDIVGYIENGRVSHHSIVTGYDSKGYPLVNSHTTDRYCVPWDLGWNDADIQFYLLRVNY